MKSFGLVGLVGFAIVAAGCSAPVDSAESADVAASDLREGVKSVTVTPGEFKIYDFAASRPDAFCDVHGVLSLDSGKAAIREELLGACEIYVAPNERAYALRATDAGCGSKLYEGKRRVRFSLVGPDSANFATVKIWDHRGRVCRDRVAGPVIVEESTPTATGVFATTRRALDAGTTPAPRTVKGTLVRTMGIGGENTGASLTTDDGKTIELVLDADQKRAFVDGRVARVTGVDTTLNGVETGTRNALRASELLVCLAPGSWINLMPGPRPAFPAPPALPRGSVVRDIQWELANCPDVNAAY